jgi:hypothetical protein
MMLRQMWTGYLVQYAVPVEPSTKTYDEIVPLLVGTHHNLVTKLEVIDERVRPTTYPVSYMAPAVEVIAANTIVPAE